MRNEDEYWAGKSIRELNTKIIDVQGQIRKIRGSYTGSAMDEACMQLFYEYLEKLVAIRSERIGKKK